MRNSPEVKDGVGSLILNSVNAYVNVLQGDLDKSFERILRCGEIMEKNPGLMRLPAW